MYRNQIIIYTFLISFLLSAVSAPAQSRHNLDVWGGGGYDALLHGIDQSRVPGGGGVNVGLGYELNINNFILQTGAEFKYFGSKSRLVDYRDNLVYEYNDGQGGVYDLTYHYNYLDYSERHRGGYVDVPVLFGWKFNRYYALLGAKLGLNLFGSYRSEMSVQPTLTDPSAIEEFTIYDPRPASYEGSLPWGLNLSASAEFGVVLDEWLPAGMKRLNNRRRTPMSYRAGVFVDYGLLNINQSVSTDRFLSPEVHNPLSWEQRTMAGSDLSVGNAFNNLYAGVKLTVQFDMTKPQRRPSPKSTSDPVWFYARVEDGETHEPMSVDVAVRQGSRLLFTKRTDSGGMVSHELRRGRYTVNVKEDGYIEYRKTVSHVKEDTLEISLQRVPRFAVHVYDLETRVGIPAEISLSRLSDNVLVHKGLSDAGTGLFTYDLKSGRYQINVAAEGYIYQQRDIAFNRSDTVEFALQAIKKDVKVVLHNLFFELNKADIKPESGPALEDLYHFLERNPSVSIHIVGHTDNTGSLSYNMDLSEARARAVYEAIVSKGIAPDRLTYEGKGPNEPVATNDTEEGRAENRRVEFVIK